MAFTTVKLLRPTLLTMALCLATTAVAQDHWYNNAVLTGNVQGDFLFPQEDEELNTGSYDRKMLDNLYLDLKLSTNKLDLGTRAEIMKYPLPGYESDFDGSGVPYFYAKWRDKYFDLTVGDFYEQFGSGFILRTYEERSLGIDNSLRGGRLVLYPYKGMRFKLLSGKQRRYWEHNKALVSGADMELNFDQWISALENNATYLTLGASWVNKHEEQETIMADPTHCYNFPEYTNAFDVRVNLQKGNFSLLGEYASKTQDPNIGNNFCYDYGNVGMLSASYSKPGLSILLQSKRSEQMAFRSRRNVLGTSSFINHLPAFTMEHTYALAALYPYATNPDGEWAHQAQLAYTFKKKTALGGKYGTEVKLNFSHVSALHSEDADDSRYYQDLNVQLTKKFTKDFKLNLMYMNQYYNKTVVEGEGGTIHSNIFVADGAYKFNRKLQLRTELQYLTTIQDEGDWAYALFELSLAPRWMFTVSDQWNCGETDIHYYQGLVTCNLGEHHLQMGYGKTRAGFNCSGGVCRYVPASKGLTIAYTYNF